MVMGFYDTTWQSLVWKSHLLLFAKKWRVVQRQLHQMLYVCTHVSDIDISSKYERRDRTCSLGRKAGNGYI
jgi:hypothetical protein